MLGVGEIGVARATAVWVFVTIVQPAGVVAAVLIVTVVVSEFLFIVLIGFILIIPTLSAELNRIAFLDSHSTACCPPTVVIVTAFTP